MLLRGVLLLASSLLFILEGICKTYAKHCLCLNILVLRLVVVELEVELCREVLRSLDIDGVLPTNCWSNAIVYYASLLAIVLLCNLVDPTVERVECSAVAEYALLAECLVEINLDRRTTLVTLISVCQCQTINIRGVFVSLGEWSFANELASLPVFDALVEALIERGLLTPPENRLGAEGCWMSVEK